MPARSLARNVAIVGMRNDRADQLVRISTLAKNFRTSRRVLSGRAMRIVGPAFVVEIMQQCGQSPEFFIGAGPARIGAHTCFDGQCMLAQIFVLCVFAEQSPGVVSSWHGPLPRKNTGEHTATSGSLRRH